MTTIYPVRPIPPTPVAVPQPPKVHQHDWDRPLREQLQYLHGCADTAGSVTITAEFVKAILDELQSLRERLASARQDVDTLKTREKRRKERDAKA